MDLIDWSLVLLLLFFIVNVNIGGFHCLQAALQVPFVFFAIKAIL